MKGKGVKSWVVEKICDGKPASYSPTRLVRSDEFKRLGASNYFVPIKLFHGVMDKCLPPLCTKNFAKALEDARVNHSARYYPNKGHTDVIIEDVFANSWKGTDPLISDMVRFILATSQKGVSDDDLNFSLRYWWFLPPLSIQIARLVNPL